MRIRSPSEKGFIITSLFARISMKGCCNASLEKGHSNTHMLSGDVPESGQYALSKDLALERISVS
jgi:hypothetical protein